MNAHTQEESTRNCTATPTKVTATDGKHLSLKHARKHRHSAVVSVDILTSPIKELIACLLFELFASLHTNSNGILFCPGSLSAFKPVSAQKCISGLYILTNSKYCKNHCMSKTHTCAWHQYTKLYYVCLKCLSACSQFCAQLLSQCTQAEALPGRIVGSLDSGLCMIAVIQPMSFRRTGCMPSDTQKTCSLQSVG